jgi:Trk-type K+ transport system membrane component
MVFEFNNNLKNMFITHFVLTIIFTIIYVILFNNPDKHYLLNSNIPKEEYLKNKVLNSLYLSVNLQTTTGYVDFNLRSPLARLFGLIQLFISLIVTIGYIALSMKK